MLGDDKCMVSRRRRSAAQVLEGLDGRTGVLVLAYGVAFELGAVGGTGVPAL